MTTKVRVAATVLAVAATAGVAATALLASSGGDPVAPRVPAPDRPAVQQVRDSRLVLLSGKDDHGALATSVVTLTQDVDGGPSAGAVRDGTLARVTAARGEWLHVTTVEGPHRSGWVNDFFLRGVLHLGGPPPQCRSRVAGRLLAAGEQVEVLELRSATARVRTLSRPRTEGLVPRRYLAELPPRDARCRTAKEPGHQH